MRCPICHDEIIQVHQTEKEGVTFYRLYCDACVEWWDTVQDLFQLNIYRHHPCVSIGIPEQLTNLPIEAMQEKHQPFWHPPEYYYQGYYLHQAIVSRDFDAVDIALLDSNAVTCLDNAGNTLLHLATMMCKDAGFIEMIVRAGADVNTLNYENRTPLHEARTPEIARLLLANGAVINQQDSSGNTPLHYAPPDVAHLYIDAGADVNCQNIFGRSPLHIRCELYSGKEQHNVIQHLLDHGADINARNIIGDTPLHALNANNADITSLLIEAGGDVNAINIDGRTPLFFAAYYGSIIAIHRLIHYGAAVNARDKYGYTPLHFMMLTSFDFPNVVKELLSAGSDLKLTDNNGNTPYALAIKKQHIPYANIINDSTE